MPDEIKFFGEGLPYLKNNECKGKLIAIEGTDGVGRSTQIELLVQWLKVRGYGVVVTGWTRSRLMSKAIEYAKSGTMLDRLTFSLLYATDFADRLENDILPALRSGFIVIADRYVYTAFARDSVRDPGMEWIQEVYGFAPIPHLVCYMRIDVDNLIPRVIESGGMDYWESGMDLHLADNIFDSFKKYQKKMIEAYDTMAESHGFEVLDARRSVEEIQNDLRTRIEKTMKNNSGNVVPLGSLGGSEIEPPTPRLLSSTQVAEQLKRLERSFSLPGAAEPSEDKAPAALQPEEPQKNPEASGIVRPFASVWTPPFHIPEDPEPNNS